MIRAACDLHIHSCLSPCSDEDMTPNNIVLMAKLKGLDAIAVTDHNHTGNLKAFSKVAHEQGLLLIPGLELETSEEIHLLCYFPSLSAAEQMQSILNNHYQWIPNREEIFGTQWLVSDSDEHVSKVEHLLTVSTTLDLYQAISVVRQLQGVVLPAHIDRESYSILSNLGSIPEDLSFKTLELSRYTCREALLMKYPEYAHYQMITSSDAHALGKLFEREAFVELDELSIPALLKHLGG